MADLDPSDPLVFRNPILPGFNPDPTVCVVPAADGHGPATYFLSTSSFEYSPGCPIYASTDLLRWRLVGHALTRRSQAELRTVEPGAGAWASTLRYRAEEGRWYLATCLFQRYRPASDVCTYVFGEEEERPGLGWAGLFYVDPLRLVVSLVDFVFLFLFSVFGG